MADEKPDSVRPLEMLIEHEEMIARLYGAFAQKFPEARDFWRGISGEESSHVHWLRRLGEIMAEGGASFHPDRFNLRAVATALEYLQVLLDRASESISMKQALAFAAQIENSIIERRFFEAFEGNTDEARRILELLVKETAKHLEWVSRRQEQAGKTSPPPA
jgi:hypothetical protein